MRRASSSDVDWATLGRGVANMRSAVDSARESDDRDFCMMGPPMQERAFGGRLRGVARRTHDRKCTAIMRGGNQVGQRSNVALLENHDFPLGNPTGCRCLPSGAPDWAQCVSFFLIVVDLSSEPTS